MQEALQSTIRVGLGVNLLLFVVSAATLLRLQKKRTAFTVARLLALGKALMAYKRYAEALPLFHARGST